VLPVLSRLRSARMLCATVGANELEARRLFPENRLCRRFPRPAPDV